LTKGCKEDKRVGNRQTCLASSFTFCYPERRNASAGKLTDNGPVSVCLSVASRCPVYYFAGAAVAEDSSHTTAPSTCWVHIWTTRDDHLVVIFY